MNKTAKNIIIRVVMLLGVAAFVFLMIMAKMNRDELKVKNIRISVDEWNGNFFISKSQVLNFVQEQFDVKNKILTGKDLERIEKAVRVIPQVKESNAYTDDQGYLNIKIVQRIPIARVYNMEGESFYIDETGIKFPTSNYFAAKVPIITGNIAERCDSSQQVQGNELKKIYKVVQTINKNKLWKEMVGQYNVNERGQVELIPRFGNCSVLFGDEKNGDEKLKRLDIFYFDVLKKIGWNYYKVINIMYKDQVICLK
jgi:cell division protein FtsQ